MKLDIVIPSIRLDARFLLPLLAVDKPHSVAVQFYVVSDDPGSLVPDVVLERARRGDVTILRNERNLGAGLARNRGFEAGAGEFVLFLDDDVTPEPGLLNAYVKAILGDTAGSPGYVGVTRFPPPLDAFTRGIVASDILTFFDLPATRAVMPWGVTANLCLRRAAVGDHRFSDLFPPAGGGEDIDLCLRMVEDAGKPFLTVPDAVVCHPWWNEGRRDYSRFFRWALGDSSLPSLHPRHAYANLPSLPEWILLLAPLVFLATGTGQISATRAAKLLCSTVGADFLIDYAKLLLRGSTVSPRVSMEATVVRLSNDLGRLFGNARAGFPLKRLFRFDYFGTRESVAYERKVAAAKAALWVFSLARAFRGR